MALAYHVIFLTAVTPAMHQSVQLALAQLEQIAQHAKLDLFTSLHLNGDAKLATFQTAKLVLVLVHLQPLVMLAKMATIMLVQVLALVAWLIAALALMELLVQHVRPAILIAQHRHALLRMLLALRI